MTENIEETLFREVQRMRQWWLFLLIGICTAGAWFTFLVQIPLDDPFGGNSASDYLAWGIWVIFGLGLPVFFISVKLVVTVDPTEIHVSYIPLIRRRILPEQIGHSYMRTYRPLREYGGWGVRWSSKYGWAFNVSGNRGVQLELADGRKLLIGSQKPEELLQAIEAMRGAPASE